MTDFQKTNIIKRNISFFTRHLLTFNTFRNGLRAKRVPQIINNKNEWNAPQIGYLISISADPAVPWYSTLFPLPKPFERGSS